MAKVLFPCIFLTALLAASTSSYKVTLEDILLGKYIPSYLGGIWISETEFSYARDGHVLAINAAANTTRILINGDQLDQAQFPGRELQLSGDGRYILITHSVRLIMDIYWLAKFHVHDTVTMMAYPLNPPGHPGGEQAEMELVLWTPNRASNALVFVYERNIYFQPTAAQGAVARQITFDGDTATNGRVDWFPIPGDMFGTGKRVGFSPDGSHLAFVKFDETPVPEYTFLKYGEPGDPKFQYPEVVSIRFPKTGGPNGIQSMHVVNLTDPGLQPRLITYPADISPDELEYIGTAKWRTETDLVVMWLPRRQQRSYWLTCNVAGSEPQPCRHIWSELETNGWINAYSMTFSRDGSTFLTPSNALTPGAAKSYRHIIKLTLGPSSPALVEHFDPVLFNGAAMHVDDVLGWNEQTNTVYFKGNTQPDASEQHIYSVRNSTGGILQVECVSCTKKNSNGEDCHYNEAFISPEGAAYMFHACLGPGVPEFVVRRTDNPDIIQVLEANAALRAMMADTETPIQRNYNEIPLPSGFNARARLYLPPDFDPARKYPLLVEVFAGPEHMFNTYIFEVSWWAYLTGSRDVIYARIDGSTSSRQSREQMFLLNNNVGNVDPMDQIEATRWLVQETGFIDPNKTAIWGWSYSGYVASMAIAKDTGPAPVFNCGIAKAPSSNFLYLTTMNAERYMGLPTPDDNLDGYLAADLSLQVEGFRGKEYLLIHGNADVNAHYQNSMVLMRALEKAGILFTALSYPDELHAISGPGMFAHQYHTFERFLFRDCGFAPTTPTENIPSESPKLRIQATHVLSVAISAFMLFSA